MSIHNMIFLSIEWIFQDNFPTGNLQANFEISENTDGMGGMKCADVNAY